jgi:hypothetical protein
VSIDQRNGLPALSKGGATAISSDFVFWAKDWSWAGLSAVFKVVGPYEYAITGNNQPLNFGLNGRVQKQSNQRLSWEFDLDATRTTPDVIGGGMDFKLDLANFGAELGEPELLPDNRGWTWGRAGRDRLEMRFDPPLSSVYFERGQRSDVRAFFYAGAVPQGHHHYVATLSLYGDMAIAPTTAERFGLGDNRTWATDILDSRKAPVDLSFLNAPEKPAGKHGFLRADGGKLIFQDGTGVRFWGTNLTAYALFATTRENVRLQAHRLSELGFNLVRFHHHDSSWVVPNIFGDKAATDTKNLSPAMLEKLDWWIKCLKDEGIYVWLDLEVGREFKPADGIDGFVELSKGGPVAGLRGYNYINASVQRAMQRFNENYLDHRNVFTGLSYKDDPAIAVLLLTNENDVTSHFGNFLLPDKNVPQHTALYMAQANAFAAKFGLAKDKTWRSWEPGPSKLFLNDLEHRFDVDMIDQLQKIGVKAPVVTTSSWGNEPLSSLPALLSGDLVDVHAYGGIGELEKNPSIAPTLVDWMAAAHVIGRPLAVTEWNVSPFPTPDRHSTPLYVAGAASLQGWDALMQFAYSQQPLAGRGAPSNWDAFNDPALVATLPAAALLYRRADVQEAKTTYVFAPTPDQLFSQSISPENSVALRTAAEQGKLLIAMPKTRELPWLEQSTIPTNARVITDSNHPLIDGNPTHLTSDTGEVDRNWELGVYTINTPRSQLATGWIGGKQITLSDVDVAVATPNASVAVQSLDDHSIGESHSIMISLGARSDPKWGNQMPFHSEPVEGQISIRAPKGLKLYRHEKNLELPQEMSTKFANGRYQIPLDKDLQSYWLFLK